MTRTEDRSALFWRALGDDFDQLPEALRALHETSGLSVWRGQARVDGPANWVAGLVGRLIGFPARGGEAPVEVMIDAGATRSIWRRRIGQARFASRLSSPEPGGQIRERFGFLTMKLQLQVQGERLAYLMQGWSLGVLPLPKALAPRTKTMRRWTARGGLPSMSTFQCRSWAASFAIGVGSLANKKEAPGQDPPPPSTLNR